MSKYVEIYEGLKVPDTASHVKPLGMTLFYRIIGGWLEYYSDSKGEWKISEGVLEDVVELPLAEPAINWNEAPDWADSVARADWSNQLAWCCSSQYQYIGLFNSYQIINTHTFTLIEMRPLSEPSDSGAETDSIDSTLKERGSRYGEYKDNARVAQEIKRVMKSGTNSGDLRDIQREALEVIAAKIARIVNGDPDYIDNWHDIAGYARLVEIELGRMEAPKPIERAIELEGE